MAATLAPWEVFSSSSRRTGTLTTLYKFNYLGPSAPNDLHQAADGSFYGTTTQGGAHYAGTVFKLTANGTMTTLVDFPALPPDSSTAPNVLLASDGNYYGTAAPFIRGLTNPGGSVYKLTPTGTLTTLYTFNGNDGFHPSALIQAADGSFYGTTYQGGTSNLGTVFKVTPDGTLTFLHNFTSTEGNLPLTTLLQADDGSFYGTTSAGGAGRGTVFRMTADGTVTTIHPLAEGEGDGLTAPLVQGGDGNLYGSSSGYYVGLTGGGSNLILFELTPDGTWTTLHTFASNEGTPTTLPLVPDGAGNFFGFANNPSAGGNIFKETPSAVPLVYAPPPVVTPTVTLVAAIPQVTAGNGGLAEFLVSLSAVQDHDVTISYTIKGSAANGTDYVHLSGTKKIQAGKLSKPIKVVPEGDLGGASKKSVVLTLAPGSGYTVGTTGRVKVKIVSGQ